MRVVFTLHDEASPDAGGMGVAAGLGAAYERLGHRVEYLSLANLPTVLPFRVRAVLFPAYVALRLRRSGADVIDASVGDAWVLGSLRRRGRRPLLVTRSHGLVQMADRARREEARLGGLELSWKYPLYWGGFRLWEVARSLRVADLCLLLNDEERDYALQELGLPRERVRVVDNGIPAELLGLPLAPPERPLRVAHIGSYLPLKGVRYVVAALERFLADNPGSRATFLGAGCPAEQVLSDFDPEVRDRVDVVERYGRAELPDLLRGYAAVVSGTLKEGFPLGTLEAMACGLAAVTPNTPGPLQYVRDGENGLVVPRRDPEALAAALQRLADSPQLLGELRAAAHATAQSYGWDRIAADTLALYGR